MMTNMIIANKAKVEVRHNPFHASNSASAHLLFFLCAPFVASKLRLLGCRPLVDSQIHVSSYIQTISVSASEAQVWHIRQRSQYKAKPRCILLVHFLPSR